MAKDSTSRGERATSRIQRTLTMIGKRKPSTKRTLDQTASKENVSDVPKGANFAPTPVEAWGSAVVLSESAKTRSAKKPAKKQPAPAQPPKPVAMDALAASAPAEPLFSPNAVRVWDWDHEQVLLDGWNLAFNGSRPLQLSGKVFNNAGPGLEDGDAIEYTSQVVAVQWTRCGTFFALCWKGSRVPSGGDPF